MGSPRPYTAEELRSQFLGQVHSIVAYWARQDVSRREIADGVAFSLLSLLDGDSPGMPPCDLVCRPHATAQAFLEEEGESWIRDGTLLNGEVALHVLYSKKLYHKGGRDDS